MNGENDRTKGTYRRIYSGFLLGNRINSVSEKAELWFWRLNAIADDWGNLPALPRWLLGAAAPKRSIDEADAGRRTDELIAAGLLQEYESAGDRYLHIVGFEVWQPVKNGKRVQRYPRPIQINPTESRSIHPPPIPTLTPIPIPIPTLTPSGESVTVREVIDQSVTRKETPPEGMPWESTSSGPDKDAEAAIFNAYPSHENRSAAVAAITKAARRIALRDNSDIWTAYVWLYHRVCAYAKSGLVKSRGVKYVKQCANWMEIEGYDDDDKAWAAPAAPAPVDIGAAAAALVRKEQAERRAKAARQGAER